MIVALLQWNQWLERYIYIYAPQAMDGIYIRYLILEYPRLLCTSI